MDTTVVTQFVKQAQSGSLAGMALFLKELPKAELLAVRAKTKELLRGLSWSQTAEHDRLFLAGLATYSKQEALGRSFELPANFNQHNARHQQGHQQLFMEVVRHSRPTWLVAWLQREARQSTWQIPPYRLLRELLAEELITHDPWLFAQSTATWLSRYNLNGNSNAREFEVHVLRQLQADTTLLTRDLPLLLDFDTPADAASIHRGKHGPDITWLTLLPQVLAGGALDRTEWLTHCLLALRRDFRRPLLTWMKGLFLALQPTPAERLTRQAELRELLAHPLPLVVNFALDQLKDLWADPDFATTPLLPYTEGLLARHDLKTGLRTLLAGLEKLLKREPTLAPALAPALATALAHADAAIQERTAKLLATLLGAKKPLLTSAETIAVQADIAIYTDLLSAGARTTLAPWLADLGAPSGALATTESYTPQADFQPDISAATAIAPVADWHEWLFLTGPVLTQNDPADHERWLEGLLRLRPQFPAGFAHQLLPVLHRVLLWHLEGKQEAEVWKIMANCQSSNGKALRLPLALLASQLPGSAGPRVPRVSLAGDTHSHPDPLLRVERQRLAFAEQQLAAGPAALPLLSTPTHAPHWLAPSALLARLRTYEAASQEPDPADLALALARTACHAAADADAARQLLPQVQHAGLRELLGWFLAPAGPPLPLPTLAARQSVGQVLGGLLRRVLPTAPNASVSPSLAAALPWLWAVAARTRYPRAVFEELRPLADYPGVAAPWQPGWQFEPVAHVHQQRWNKEQPTRTETWTELRVPTEQQGQQPASPLLLYSLHARLKQSPSRYLWSLVGGIDFLLSLLPNNPAPLHWHVVRTLYHTNATYGEERGVQQQLLHTLLRPGPTFAEPTTLLLAIALLQSVAAGRALALEVLLAAIEHGRLVPLDLGHTLGRLLAADFAPVPRLTDNLVQARALGARPDDALCQLLEALLPELPTTPPRQTAKLLAAYADLVARTRRPVPAAVQARLREWGTSATLKKTAAPLLVAA